MPPAILLPLLQFVQSVLPGIAKLWREIHSDDPAKATWTDAEAIANLIATGDRVADKWAAYKRDNP
jgi:hypothetical protein